MTHRESYSVKWRRKCGRGVFLLRKSKLRRDKTASPGLPVGGRGKRMKPTQGQDRGRVLEGREERQREADREGEQGMEDVRKEKGTRRQTRD